MFRVVETFSGIGSQAKALENLGVDFEITNTVEWDINAIIAYCLIHKGKIDTKKYDNISNNDIVEKLCKFTLSSDGKKKISESAFKRLPINIKRALYASIKETNNLVSITDVSGKDIPNNIDLLTYSFPCQDLSLCGCWHGNKSGISRSAHNRSGMLWEIERILKEMDEGNQTLPRFLLMENVTNILSKTHKEDFDDWKATLESLGYYNKIYVLNAMNFGIPQKRKRAYMLSVRCDNENIKSIVDNYFVFHDLESAESQYEARRKLTLNDILKTDYSNKQYKIEADLSNPNDTMSRREIMQDNAVLFSKGKINDIIVNTVTTKQDRNPNSGVLMYDNNRKGKSKFRYLTPRECFLLMGFEEKDFQVLIDNNYQINKTRKLFTIEKLIKLAGNSIVVDVLEAIFSQMMEIKKLIDGDE